MLDINFEFIKGILFVRLEGNIDSKNSKNIQDNIISIIRNGGIKYLVLNVKNLVINGKVSLFDSCYESIKYNKGKMFICGLKSNLDKVISHNYRYCDSINSELLAIKVLNLC